MVLLAVTVFLKINILATRVRKDACVTEIVSNWFICSMLIANVLSIYFFFFGVKCFFFSLFPVLSSFPLVIFSLMCLISNAAVACS